MTELQTVYRPLISARSRRLRIIGTILLISVLAMTLYGYFVLMPSLRTLPRITPPVAQSAANVQRPTTAGTGILQADILRPMPKLSEPKLSEPKLSEGTRKTALAKVIFIYGYWSVCGVLLISLLLVCWLDFRELTHVYEDQRQRLYLNFLATQSDDPGSKG